MKVSFFWGEAFSKYSLCFRGEGLFMFQENRINVGTLSVFASPAVNLCGRKGLRKTKLFKFILPSILIRFAIFNNIVMDKK